jgi:hypothetical protein
MQAREAPWKRRNLRRRWIAMSKTTRTEVIDAAGCPFCGAEPGEPCLGLERRNGSRRQRKRCHAERWKAAGVDTRAERERRDLEAIASLREERTRRRLEAAARLGR